MKFNPGKIVVTRSVYTMMMENTEFATHIYKSLNRHVAGDWGEIRAEDKLTNETALMDGERLFSAYTREGLPPIWIVTEWDRSVTTVLFPDEY
ncbi:hypothetical protein [Geobacter sp. SVR]|uniref:hypothetical protein n=1 Tax=Geobacter sp. SVR TaxID=2495594 RepID=UPI00143EFF90|nr:hypothetical protein [Geobacter sp. SVR]BCS52628.1 hypothetical protein GSVR_09360 [Geobacter sp. SVR]GCF83935.1 hypothetical protein GSbR_05350 [Geobacter sp. SVR]